MSDQKKMLKEEELNNISGGAQQRDPGEEFYNNAKSTKPAATLEAKPNNVAAIASAKKLP